MTKEEASIIANALEATLISPNELDSNLEAANIADGLFAIARSINRVAITLERLGWGDILGPDTIVDSSCAPLGIIARAIEKINELSLEEKP